MMIDTIKTERLSIEPFDIKYLKDYFDGFNQEITKFQWPDPFPDMDSARIVLQDLLDEFPFDGQPNCVSP